MTKGALEGVKVADFSWQLMVPWGVQYFAENGATVVRIESMKNIDTQRTTPPRRGEGLGQSGWYSFFTCNRHSMGINLKHPRGAELAKRVVAWADIATSNFTAGTMKRWGLDYESLKKVNPDIIMLEGNVQGQSGPNAEHPGFGVMGVALVGVTNMTGWPDRSPVMPFVGYTDLVSPRFVAASLLAALDYRDRTGKGVHIDLSQLETGMQFIGPLLMEYANNGSIAQRCGNESEYAAPHNSYRCRGDDRWCTIVILSDAEWQELVSVMGKPSWALEERFATLAGRKQHEREIDALIGRWTESQSPEEVMAKLQAAGIAAGVVRSPADIFDDPQIKERGHFWVEEFGALGKFHHNGPAYRLTRTPSQFRFPPPDIGADTEWVCKSLLGMSENEYVEYLVSEVFE